jgi:hypothetical protein
MKDAAMLERELFPVFQKEDVVGLPHYRCYVRLMVNGVPTRPFSARVIYERQISEGER